MRKFKSGRLVRDKIIKGIFKSGNKAKYQTLNNPQYISQLKRKLSEEAQEIAQLKLKEEIVKEIADIQEVIDNLIRALGISKQQLKQLQKRKTQKAGSFKKKLYLEQVEVSEDSKWLEYYLSQPKLFPEIKK